MGTLFVLATVSGNCMVTTTAKGIRTASWTEIGKRKSGTGSRTAMVTGTGSARRWLREVHCDQIGTAWCYAEAEAQGIGNVDGNAHGGPYGYEYKYGGGYGEAEAQGGLDGNPQGLGDDGGEVHAIYY